MKSLAELSSQNGVSLQQSPTSDDDINIHKEHKYRVLNFSEVFYIDSCGLIRNAAMKINSPCTFFFFF